MLAEEHEGIPRSYVRRDLTLIWGNIFFRDRIINIWNALDDRTVTSATLNSCKKGLERLRNSRRMGLLWSSVAKDSRGRTSLLLVKPRRWVSLRTGPSNFGDLIANDEHHCWQNYCGRSAYRTFTRLDHMIHTVKWTPFILPTAKQRSPEFAAPVKTWCRFIFSWISSVNRFAIAWFAAKTTTQHKILRHVYNIDFMTGTAKNIRLRINIKYITVRLYTETTGNSRSFIPGIPGNMSLEKFPQEFPEILHRSAFTL